MSAHEVRQAYDEWHQQHHQHSPGIGNPLSLPWYESAFPDICRNASGQFLEIGCGRGEFAIWLSKILPSLRISGVDFSETAIDVARQKALSCGGQLLEFMKQDAESLEFPDAHFDYVLSCECIEHVERPARVAEQIFRVLKPGGRFCITTENYFNGMLLMWMKSWLTGQPFNSGAGVQPRENFFLFWQVSRYLKRAGLIVDRTESCHYQWLMLPGVDPAKLRTDRFFAAKWAQALCKPFGRHFSYFGRKPDTIRVLTGFR